jgi:hypothetical protein
MTSHEWEWTCSFASTAKDHPQMSGSKMLVMEEACAKK